MQRPQAVRKEEAAFTPPPRFSSNPLLWIGLVMIALIVSIIFFGERKAPSERAAETTSRAVPSDEVALPDEDLPEPSTVEETAIPADIVPPTAQSGEEARAIIAKFPKTSEESDLDTVFKQAEQLAESQKREDAYLLYFFAARKGHAPSAFMLGHLSDPNHYSREISPMDQADPLQALKWYRAAVNLGYKKASPRLKELEIWIKEQAHAGNAQARQLLLNLP